MKYNHADSPFSSYYNHHLKETLVNSNPVKVNIKYKLHITIDKYNKESNMA